MVQAHLTATVVDEALTRSVRAHRAHLRVHAVGICAHVADARPVGGVRSLLFVDPRRVREVGLDPVPRAAPDVAVTREDHRPIRRDREPVGRDRSIGELGGQVKPILVCKLGEWDPSGDAIELQHSIPIG